MEGYCVIIQHIEADVFLEYAGFPFDSFEYSMLTHTVHEYLKWKGLPVDTPYSVASLNNMGLFGKAGDNPGQLTLNRYWYIPVDDRRLPPIPEYHQWLLSQVEAAKSALKGKHDFNLPRQSD